MNVDELQSVQSRERQTDKLQQLRATFYADAGKYVNQLREERKRAAQQADDPFDNPEVTHLTDDINTAEKTIEAIYERRVGKIVKMASLAAADMPTEDDGLTREERELFETMVAAIKENRNHVLDVIAGDAPSDVAAGAFDDEAEAGADAATEAPGEEASEATPSGVGAADVMGGASDAGSGRPSSPAPDAGDAAAGEESADRPAAEAAAALGEDADPASPPEAPPSEPGAAESEQPADGGSAADTDVERRTVRITEDVGEIFGVDEREYDLSRDDVVMLPRDNADPLVEQNAAEPLE